MSVWVDTSLLSAAWGIDDRCIPFTTSSNAPSVVNSTPSTISSLLAWTSVLK